MLDYTLYRSTRCKAGNQLNLHSYVRYRYGCPNVPLHPVAFETHTDSARGSYMTHNRNKSQIPMAAVTDINEDGCNSVWDVAGSFLLQLVSRARSERIKCLWCVTDYSGHYSTNMHCSRVLIRCHNIYIENSWAQHFRHFPCSVAHYAIKFSAGGEASLTPELQPPYTLVVISSLHNLLKCL